MSRPVSDRVTLEYGVPGPYSAGFHTGRDYGCFDGTPVHATRTGKVVEVNAWGPDYGLHVVMQSVGPAGKTVRHGYCHLSRIDVKAGEQVKGGARIGLSGQTGNVSGPHLHYEERLEPYSYNDVVRSPRFDLL